MTLQKNRALSEDFTKLHLELEREGLFKPSYIHTILRVTELLLMAGVGFYLLQRQHSVAKFVGIFLIGLVQGRFGWIQHDSGHHALTGNPKLDRFLQTIFIG